MYDTENTNSDMRTRALAMSNRKKEKIQQRGKLFFNFSATTTTTSTSSENGKTDTVRPTLFSVRCAADVSFYFSVGRKAKTQRSYTLSAIASVSEKAMAG